MSIRKKDRKMTNGFWKKSKKTGAKRSAPSADIPPMPSWETTVELLYDKQLDSFYHQMVRVIYSKDHAMRYVILKDAKGTLTYQLEEICPFSEEEWQYVCRSDDALPAMWESVSDVGKSIFNTEEDVRKAIQFEPAYRQYFQ